MSEVSHACPSSLHTRLNALSLSVDLGHGPTAHFDDWTVRAVCEGSSFDDIPSELRHSLMIERTNHDALLLLSKDASTLR